MHYRRYNFYMLFFQTCLLCATTLFVHFWVTIASVALDLQLGTAGSALGDSFQKRLQSAQETLRRPTKMEWVHIGLFGFDFAFSNFAVFGANSVSGLFAAGLGPGLGMAFGMWMLAKARPVMLQHLRTNTEQFANQAVRGQMKVLLIQTVLVIHSAGWWLTITVFPRCGGLAGDYFPNLDEETNASYTLVANVTHCQEIKPWLFREPLVSTNDGAVFYAGKSNGEAWGHSNGQSAVMLYLCFSSFLFYIARAQGIIHDRLIDSWEMERTHVVALSLWCVASMAVLILATIDWNGVTDRRVTHLWGTPCIITCKWCAATLPAFAQKAETKCPQSACASPGLLSRFGRTRCSHSRAIRRAPPMARTTWSSRTRRFSIP